MTSASTFFSKIRKFCKKALLTLASFILFLVSLAILEDNIYKTKGHDCEHHIAFWILLEGLNREIATFTLGINITDHWSRLLATDRNDDNFRLGPVRNDIVLRLLEMCFALRENKVAVTEEKCVEERISLASLKEDTYWVKQVYYVQSRSGLLVKLRLLSEWPSTSYGKATIKQKSNTVKFPHHLPYTLPHLCFSPPSLLSLPQSKSLFCKTWSDEKIIMHAKETKWKLLYKTSKFLRNIGTFEEPG